MGFYLNKQYFCTLKHLKSLYTSTMAAAAFNGKWKRTDAENGLEFAKYIGIPDEILAKLAQAGPATMEISVNGNVWNEKYTQGGNTRENTLTVGSPSKFTQWNGSVADVTPSVGADNSFTMEYTHNGI